MHMRAMLAALFTSALFLCSYLLYHWTVGSVPYPHHDWTRWLYFAVLIPHAVLAMVMVPFILLSLWHAYRRQFGRHARITRWVWPVWMYVSVSGVVSLRDAVPDVADEPLCETVASLMCRSHGSGPGFLDTDSGLRYTRSGLPPSIPFYRPFRDLSDSSLKNDFTATLPPS